MLYDALHPPAPFDPHAAAYKEWLHLNLFDHQTGSIGLVNVSLHGAPADPRSRAVGAALVHVPGRGWIGNLEITGLAEAAIGYSSIRLEKAALAIDPLSSTLMASVQDPANQLILRTHLKTVVPPVVVDGRLPLGSGWISWYAAPRLAASGEWTVAQQRADLSTASAYYDHNWGQWHWGDNFGWEWGSFLTPPNPSGSAVAVVFSRTTDRTHRRAGLPFLTVYVRKKQRTFPALAIRLEYTGELDAIQRRLPGALAALHQDQMHVRLPKQVALRADDGFDWINLEFSGRSAAQLITGDPAVRGYSFIHEIAGEFTYAGRIAKESLSGSGLGVLEYVC